MATLDFVFFDAGGGHRAAAQALRLAIQLQKRPWEVRLVNLQEILDPIDIFRKLTGVRLQDIYNTLLKKGWTLGAAQLLPLMHSIIRLYHRRQVEILERYWRQARPDLVVSLIPNFNRALFDSLLRALPKTPLVTVLTDLADYPPHFWLEAQDQWVVCGTDRAVEQARRTGIPAEKIFRASGMILHPRFYEPQAGDRKSERERLGLLAGRPTGLVLFGGQGSRVMEEILLRLDASGLELQLIMICGHNERLAARLRSRRTRIPVFVEGFTDQVPAYMRLADFFIGKPGPGSISEALAMGLPVIVQRNAWTLPQERFNTEWVRENGFGLVVHSFREIERAVQNLLDPVVFQQLKDKVASYRNRAVFEIPDFLNRVLETPR
jgi:1,2-diacylglycerol 3-beta-galactosyltransferase